MNNSAEIFLQVRDLLIQFHSKHRKHDAVKRVSFDIFKGEIFSIVGESGSGKTTIARAIAGVQAIKDGSIYMNSKILRGNPPSLYKINQAINHELSLLEHNNIWISKNLNNYVTNLKITYYKYFTNKKYHHLKNELTVYHHQNFILTKDEELFKVKILNFNKNETYFKFCKNGYQENISLLKNITTKYQRINTFLFNLHHHIEAFPLALETAILSRNKIILAMIQKNILLASNIYHLFLELETAKTNFQNNLTLANAKCFYQTSFSKLAQLFKYHEQFLTNIKNIVKEQHSTFIFFVPLAQRKKYFLTYHHKYIVSKHKLYKTYNDKINSLQQNENNDKNIITDLKNKFEMIWMKTTFSLETIEMWLQKIASINNNNNISQYLEKLAFNDESNLLKKHLFSLLKTQDNDHNVITKYLKDLRYLAKYDVFCDYNTISWYHSLLNQKYEISPDEFLASYVLLDLLDLPPVDKIVQQAPIFHIPKRQELKQQKQKIQMIFQDPYSSLNDRIAISEVIGEGLNSFPELYQNDETRKWFLANYNAQLPSTEKPLTLVDVKDKDVKYFLILHILQEVGLLSEHLSRYVHEFSGGQKQRIGIARALIMNPELVIADEPISALDVSIRAQILNLLKKFQSLNNLTYIFIAHDLSIVRFISDRIAVMYNGQIVELAPAEELFTNPLHPYTKALLSAIVQPNPHYEKNRVHFVYQPEQEHYDYNYDLPDFIEVSANHYLYANKREITTLQNKKSTYLEQKGGD